MCLSLFLFDFVSFTFRFSGLFAFLLCVFFLFFEDVRPYYILCIVGLINSELILF